MSIEELKLVLATIQGISGDASTAAIWWMALHYGERIFSSIALIGVFVGIALIVGKVILSLSEWSRMTKEICKAYGCDDDYSFITADQRRAIKKAIERART